jgi:hypothetical protein
MSFVSAVRVVLRGKAHAEWKVVVSGDRRTVKDDQYFIDDRAIIWGKGSYTCIKYYRMKFWLSYLTKLMYLWHA